MTVSEDKAGFAENICTLLTPRGRGAIAVVLVCGPATHETIGKMYSRFGRSASTSVPTASYGCWDTTGEDIMLVKSGKDAYEIHCHGGESAPNSILESLTQVGFRELSSEEYSDWSAPTAWHANLTNAMIHAATERTAGVLLQQWQKLDQRIAQISSFLKRKDKAPLLKVLKKIRGWGDFGIHLTQPWCVVVCGEPNVGKSSLLNALVGFGRAIVHDQPGTTRDVVSQVTAFDGWPVELKDTAGLRDSSHPVESIGIQFAEKQIAKADLALGVFDATETWTAKNDSLVRDANVAIAVFNKLDLIEHESPRVPVDQVNSFWISALTGEGVPRLINAIVNQLIGSQTAPECLLPVTEQQLQLIGELLAMVEAEQFDDATNLWQFLTQPREGAGL